VFAVVGLVTATLAGCGGTSSSRQAQTSSIYYATSPKGSPQAGLPNLAEPAPKGPIPVFRPFAVDCVMRSFAQAGTPLYDLFGDTGRRGGLATLEPNSDRVGIEVVVLATEANARRQLLSVQYLMRLKPSSKRVMRDGNLVALYTDRPAERARLRRAKNILDRTCR
jgi:hypothetical protein